MTQRQRTAYAGLSGFFAFWAVMAPMMLQQRPEIMWALFAFGLALAIGLGVLAILGKFNDPASPYLRALKLTAIAAIAAGAVFVGYTAFFNG